MDVPPKAIFNVGAGAAYLLLILHCVRARGGRTALAFFGGCFAFGLLRDNWIWWISRFHGAVPPFSVADPPVRIGHATPLVAVGWSFTFYLGWFLAERILARAPAHRGRLFPTLLLAALAAMPISYATEAMALSAGLWEWRAHIREASAGLLGEVPVLALEGWYSTGLAFLSTFFLVAYSEVRDARRFWGLAIVPAYMAIVWLDPDVLRLAATAVATALLARLAWTSPLRLREAPDDGGARR